MTTVKIEVHYTIEVDEKYIPKLMKKAEEYGLGYGDPGKKELVRRLLIDAATNEISEILFDDYTITIHQNPKV